MTQSSLLPSDITFITPSLTSAMVVGVTVFTLIFSEVLGFDLAVLIILSNLYRGPQIRSRNKSGLEMIDQNYLFVVALESIFLGVVWLMG